MKIVIIDYGTGNFFSVKKRIDKLNVECIISNNKNIIKDADKIILPGVGNFSNVINQLNNLNIIELIEELVLVNKVPILGICLGMQLMCNMSDEGDEKGFGWFDYNVKKFSIEDKNKFRYKVPHIGWNNIKHEKDSSLLNKIPKNSYFYFIHSYHLCGDIDSNTLATTDYSYPFISAIERDNIFGVQFHPEKSHDIGKRVLLNFIKM